MFFIKKSFPKLGGVKKWDSAVLAFLGVFFDSSATPSQPSLHVTLIRTALHSLIPVNDRIHFPFVKWLYRPNIVTHESRSTTILGLQLPKLAELKRAKSRKKR